MGKGVVKKVVKRKLTTLTLLVLFLFVILLVSLIISGIIAYFLISIGILAPLIASRFPVALLFMLLVSLITATMLAIFGGDRFLRPLRELTEATKEIASGNYNVQVNNIRAREIDSLASSFNIMARELSRVETLRSDFVSNISHEFKTPVASISGFAKRLKRSNLTNEQREYIDIIISESERLARLSSNVLLLSNLESTEKNTEQAIFHLDEQIRRTVLLLEPQLQKKEIDIIIQLDTVSILANEEMLRHLWINLFNNAIKFSPIGGIIEITLKQNGGNCAVSVSDQGPGMDEEVKKHIFDKFYQSDRSRATEGNGLGLSLVKRILELENGRIRVDSEPGSGTCFTIELPIRR